MTPVNTRHSGNNAVWLDALVVGAGFGGCYLYVKSARTVKRILIWLQAASVAGSGPQRKDG